MPFFSRLLATAAPLALAASGVQADVVISSGATQNMTCSAGVCAPTAASAVLNVDDLETLLASGNVKVTTTGSGVQAKDIRIASPLSWSSTSTLELDAYRSIAVQNAVLVAGMGGLTVVTNDGGSGGTFSFGPKGTVTFQNLSSPLTINGVAFTLVNSLHSLSSAVRANPRGAFALANSYVTPRIYHSYPIAGTLKGVIEGLGNTISRLSITRGGQDFSEIAMVKIVGTSGVIENLRLTKVRMKDSGVNADVSGLVAENEGYLFGDSVTGKLSGAGVGGLVITNRTTGTIVSSWANVHATGGGNGGAAGLVAFNEGTIALSHSAGQIEGGVAGGLVALNEGTISQSYATASVDGGGGGGLVSTNESVSEPAIIENSYATGDVSGGEVGGLLYEEAGNEISSSYATGAVSGSDSGGGFVCNFGVRNYDSDYWDTTTSGTTYGLCDNDNYSAITGLTTQQLQKKLPAGFSKKIWALNPKINNGFPYLIANPPRN